MNSPPSSPLNLSVPEMAQVDPQSPWRPLLVPAIVVIVGLVIAGFLLAHFGKAKPDASGAVLRLVVYPVQVDSGGPDQDPGMPAGSVAEQNETVLLVQARVTNISRKPLTLFDMVSDVRMGETTTESPDALPEDIDRLFLRFPDLAALHMQPLLRHQVIAPGQSADGLLVFNYPWNKQQWDQHKKAQIIVSFVNGRSLVLPLP